MNKRIFGYGGRNKGGISEVGEEVGALHRLALQQVGQREIAAFEPPAANVRPLGKDNRPRRIVRDLEGQGVAPQHVGCKQIAHRTAAGGLHALRKESLVCRQERIVEMIAAERHVVRQNVDSVETRYGDYGMAFPFGLRRGITGRHDGEFATQDFDQKSALPAGGLEEPGFDALGLVFHKVAHRLDLTLGGEDLAVVGHALTRDDLRCMGFGGGHRLESFAPTLR